MSDRRSVDERREWEVGNYSQEFLRVDCIVRRGVDLFRLMLVFICMREYYRHFPACRLAVQRDNVLTYSYEFPHGRIFLPTMGL